MDCNNNEMSKELCVKLASLCSGRKMFNVQHKEAYIYAKDNNMLDLLFPKICNYTKAQCRVFAKGCDNRAEFIDKFPGVYKHSLVNGWVDEFFSKKRKKNIDVETVVITNQPIKQLSLFDDVDTNDDGNTCNTKPQGFIVTKVIGVSQKNENYKKHANVLNACIEAGISELPKETAEYFGNKNPEKHLLDEKLEIYIPQNAFCRESTKGIEIVVSEIPKDIYKIQIVSTIDD